MIGLREHVGMYVHGGAAQTRWERETRVPVCKHDSERGRMGYDRGCTGAEMRNECVNNTMNKSQEMRRLGE